MSTFAVEKLEAIRDVGKVRFYKLIKDGMITNKDLLRTPEYWTTRIQLDLYAHLQAYMEENGMNRAQLAQKLGVTKGYVTQILNGDFDHRLSKLVELSLAVGFIPKMEFVSQAEFFGESERMLSTPQIITPGVFPQVDISFGESYRSEVKESSHSFCDNEEYTDNKFRIAS